MAELTDDVKTILQLPNDRPVVTMSEWAETALKGPGIYPVSGAEGSSHAFLARAAAATGQRKVVYVAPDLDAARRAAADLECIGGALPLPGQLSEAVPGKTHLFLPPESNPYADLHPDRRLIMARAATLHDLARGADWTFLVVPAFALLRKVVPRDILLAAALHLQVDGDLELDDAARRLTEAGYLRAPVVEDPGSFAIRGGLLDVWPSGEARPLRIELFGDMVANIRYFDSETQRSLEELRELRIPPAREAITTKAASARARSVVRSLCDAVNMPSSKARRFVDDIASGTNFFGSDGFLPAFSELTPLWSYVPNDAVFVVEDPVAMRAALEEEQTSAHTGRDAREGMPHFPFATLYAGPDELEAALASRTVIAAHRTAVAGGSGGTLLERLEQTTPDTPSLATHDHSDMARAVKAARGSTGKEGALDPIVRRINAWQDAGLSTVIAARVSTQAERIAALLTHRKIQVHRWVSGDLPPPTAVRVITGPVARGVVAPAEGFVLLTEEEIFGQRAHRRTRRPKTARAALADLRELNVGDHVVHVEHGVGRYLGLEHRKLGEATVDLIVVEYTGGDKLFLPVYRMNQIQKHSGGEGTARIDRLGGQSFARTKAQVRQKVREMADELLRLYAQRGAQKKTPLPKPDDDYATFEATFPFEETADQEAAIADVCRDLESTRVMDRLVCGDVGFGKTEVAIRAAFRMALAGRQVAILCPTTVLAQQHFLTFKNRLSDYPLNIRVLSRFASKAEISETVRGLKAGTVDVVVGTHRLLSKDVHFKRLGLLVVDEEQRFGVTHKERIKQLRTTVDVLTLSATPIPRTLQLAVGGLRDMSIMTTPPVDRRAVRTITARHDEHLMVEAIRRELSRGGQVFYVYNRVEGIYERAARLQQLVPDARVAVGHGQLSEAALEKTMVSFIEGESDILCATAIIESGLDIPRANTMIIDRADLFGLSQLYQLRGRVGRSSERAYCYLLVPPPSKLTEEARSRIEALERYSELGSGFHIASLDMDLRGGGNLLGGDQSGFVSTIGFDLFCQMLEEATAELQGEEQVHDVDPELHIDVDALLPEDYINEMGVRLTIYKRLASAPGEGDVAEIAVEMEDRFGEPPLAAKQLVELMRLKTELRRLRVLGMEATGKSVTLHLREDTPLDPVLVGKLVAAHGTSYRLTPDMRITRRLHSDETPTNGLIHADQMLHELKDCMKGA